MNEDKKYLMGKVKILAIMLSVASLLIAYKSGGYYGANTSSKFGSPDTSIFSCILGGLTTPDFGFYGFNHIFFVTLGICLVLSAFGIVVFWSGEQSKIDQRIGHEHGKSRLSTPKDIAIFQKKVMCWSIYINTPDA